jgi:hypothetical protein
MEGEESKASHRAKAELLGRLQYWILPRWRIPLITRHHERRAPEVRRLALPIGADVRIVLLPVLQGRLRCRQCRERQPSERTEGMPVDEGVQPTQKDMIESRTSSTFRCRDCGQWKPNSEEQGIPNGMFGVWFCYFAWNAPPRGDRRLGLGLALPSTLRQPASPAANQNELESHP